MEALLILLLSIASVEDFRCHSIQIGYPVAFLGGAVVRQVLCPGMSVTMFIGGIAFGTAFLLLSRIKSGIIGSGDGLMLGVCGAYLGLMDVTILFVRGVFLAALWSVGIIAVQIIRTGRKKGTELPFIPCLLVAYVTMLG
ncbi:Type IV leader peptidase family protein [Lachnospiraceae bacterium XBB1006]|nr:Type IV leader peptidase family protein [Lachnospiraceae bacterium XBB1006]